MVAGAVNAAHPGKVRRNDRKERPEADAVDIGLWAGLLLYGVWNELAALF